ncbi:MAG TPA: ATP-binding protein [Polyangia bacterium]|nr:ATP-binding protein [Polyangia bacterium]
MASDARTEADLREENRILRERLERFERGPLEFVDPVMRALVDLVPAFIIVINPEGRLLATGRTSEAFGSVIGRSVFEFAEPSCHEVMKAAYARVCETKRATTYETVAYGENGEPNHSYVVRAEPMLDAGEVAMIVLVPTDITDRVRLERSLVLSEEKLRLAVEATSVGLWSWDVIHDVVSWDRRVLEIFGARTPPAGYHGFLELIHPDDRAFVHGVLSRALETGVYTPFEHRLAQRDEGERVERWVLGTGVILRDGTGRPAMMMGGALDITAQKRGAAQMQRAQRVEALGQLAAGLAHNFNNLLGAIIPNLELAIEQAVAEQGPSISAALSASLQARELVKRLMAITGPRAADGANVCDPRDVVERAAALCRTSFPKEIEIRTAVSPGVGHAALSATDLEQILLNLLFNARDALEPTTGHARVIEILVDAPAATEVRLRVRDNGMGMSEEVASRIYEPFFTTKPAHRGAGLGLADVLLRVRDAHGRLDFDSERGAGTTFTVVVPVAPAPPAEAPATRATRVSGSGETVLVVDDEAAVRTVVARVLTRGGYRVLEAGNAEEARAILEIKGGEVKLVLLDNSMPQETGPEALPSLKRLSDAPFVLFTGGMAELPPGAAALLPKPAQAAEILGVVQALIVNAR